MGLVEKRKATLVQSTLQLVSENAKILIKMNRASLAVQVSKARNKALKTQVADHNGVFKMTSEATVNVTTATRAHR